MLTLALWIGALAIGMSLLTLGIGVGVAIFWHKRNDE